MAELVRFHQKSRTPYHQLITMNDALLGPATKEMCGTKMNKVSGTYTGPLQEDSKRIRVAGSYR